MFKNLSCQNEHVTTLKQLTFNILPPFQFILCEERILKKKKRKNSVMFIIMGHW